MIQMDFKFVFISIQCNVLANQHVVDPGSLQHTTQWWRNDGRAYHGIPARDTLQNPTHQIWSRTRSICIRSFEDGLFRLVTEDGSQNLQKGWELGGMPIQSNGWENWFCRYAIAAYASMIRMDHIEQPTLFSGIVPCTVLLLIRTPLLVQGFKHRKRC